MSSCEFVTLKGGLIVRMDAWLYCLELEQRGIVLRPLPDGSDTIAAQPRTKLTEIDRERIRAWRRHILALLAYETPAVIQ